MKKNIDFSKKYPLLPLRDVVVFPHMVIPLFVGREKSINALDSAMKSDRLIVLAKQGMNICLFGCNSQHVARRLTPKFGNQPDSLFNAKNSGSGQINTLSALKVFFKTLSEHFQH